MLSERRMRAGEKLKQHWTGKAKSELLQINACVRTDNPLAAQELMVKISETLDLLSEYPGIGRVGRMKGTQEFVISSSYLLVYRVKRDGLWVLSVLHTARRWP